MFHTVTYCEVKVPDHEVGQLLLALHGDANPAVHLLPVLSCGPVLDTHHTDEVEGPGDHHDTRGLLLPHHPPEVRHGGLCGSLGHDVGLRLDQALDTIKVKLFSSLPSSHSTYRRNEFETFQINS